MGANDFFYLDEQSAKDWGLEKYTVKMLTSPRYSTHFSFDKTDWQNLRSSGAKCYLFFCRDPRSKLPKSVQQYIKWGESECRTRRGDICSEAKACQTRESDRKRYRGWYDLGEVKSVKFFTGYYGRYNRHFVKLNDKIALDADFIAYEPRVALDEDQVKAILAYLNSIFNQLYIEMNGPCPGGVGPISLEVPQANSMPVPDVRKLKTAEVKKLGCIFDDLESESRRAEGAYTQMSSEAPGTIYDQLNDTIAEVFDFDAEIAAKAKNAVKLLMERRLTKKESAHPDVITGEESPRIKPPTRNKPKKKLKIPWTRQMDVNAMCGGNDVRL